MGRLKRGVSVVINDEQFDAAPTRPFTFGRADKDTVVGLDPNDMGISATAGSVEFSSDVWWVVNRSTKRHLFIEESAATPPIRLERSGRYAITRPHVTILVPGAIYTHRLDVIVPETELARLGVPEPSSTGTLVVDDITLADKDRLVLTAMCAGFLRRFPNRDPRPRTYTEIAETLRDPWTQVTVRKQVERLKERLSKNSLFFEGPRANEEMAEYFVTNNIITVDDLALIDGATR